MSEARSAASRKWTNRFVYFFGVLGGFLWCYDTGVIGGALLFIEEDLGLGPLVQGLVVSGLAMGAALRAFSGPFADRLGRRRLALVT